jgi:hypothetical protein
MMLSFFAFGSGLLAAWLNMVLWIRIGQNPDSSIFNAAASYVPKEDENSAAFRTFFEERRKGFAVT